jgi:uncharacterized protein (DUF305 family)
MAESTVRILRGTKTAPGSPYDADHATAAPHPVIGRMEFTQREVPMSYKLRSPLLAGALAIGLAACADTPTTPTSSTPSMAPSQPSFDRPAPQPSVARYEIYYMEFTIDHHLAGIVEAQLCVERAIHEELRAMCEESIASQQRQIELFRTWLREWYGIEYAGEIPESAEQDIRRLSELYGAEFEDEFLTEFSKHHLRIIKESEKAVRTVYHEELRREAQMTITKQSQGVVMMQTWDCQWYGDCRQGLANQAKKRA